MISVPFPQANCELAKDQPQYQTLHTFVEMQEIEVPLMDVEVDERGQAHLVESKTQTIKKQVPKSMTCCFALSQEEIAEIVRTGMIWHTQMVFGEKFQPILMSTQNPFLIKSAE